ITEAHQMRWSGRQVLEQGRKHMSILLIVGGSIRTWLRIRTTGTGQISRDDPVACHHQGISQARKLLDTHKQPWEYEHRSAAALCFIIDTAGAMLKPGHSHPTCIGSSCTSPL